VKLALNCHNSGEYYGGCNYAFVDLSPELARALLHKLELTRSLVRTEDVHEVDWFSSNARFFNPRGAEDELENSEEAEWVEGLLEALEGDTPLELPKDFELTEGMEARTEWDHTVASEGGIWFLCNPKHCDEVVTTSVITEEILRKAASMEEEKKDV